MKFPSILSALVSLGLASIALVSCRESAETLDDGDVERIAANLAAERIEPLQKEVQALKSRVAELERRTVEEQPIAAARTEESEFMLVGKGAMGAEGSKFASLKRCEAAKQVLVTAANERDEQARAQGAVFVSPISVSCVPL